MRQRDTNDGIPQEKRRTLSPVYRPEDNNSFVFSGLSGSPPAARVRVMDWNRWAPPKPMGEFVLRLEDVGSEARTTWCALETPNVDMSSAMRSQFAAAQTLGSVELRVAVRPQGGDCGPGVPSSSEATSPTGQYQMISKWFDDDEPARKPNVLRVAVVSARNFELSRRPSLRKASPLSRNQRFSGPPCDPIAVIHYRGLKRSTKVERRTARPVWATTFDLARTEDGGSDRLTVDVCDARKFLEPRRLGRAQVDCAKSSPEAREYELDTKGVVMLAWKLAYDPAFDETAACDWFSDLASNDPDDEAQPDEVHVVIVRARGLRAADLAMFGRQATSDPYVKLRVVKRRASDGYDRWPETMRDGNDWAQTSVVRKSLSPVWNARFALPLDVDSPGDDDLADRGARGYRLCLEVYDRDFLSSDDFLGCADIDLARSAGEERARASTAEWVPLQGEGATGEILVAYKTSSYKNSFSGGVDSVEVALPRQPAETPRPCALSWRPFLATDDVVASAPNELRIGLKRAVGLPSAKAAVSVVFAVTKRGHDDASGTVVLEWQSKQARLFRADDHAESCEATFQQAFTWPLLPAHRDDEYALVATLEIQSSDDGTHWKLAGSAPLAPVATSRPNVEHLVLELADETGGAIAGAHCPVLHLVAQWRHNRCLAESASKPDDDFDDDVDLPDSDEPSASRATAPLADDPCGQPEETEAVDDPSAAASARSPARIRRRSTLQAIIKQRVIGAAGFRSSVNTNPETLYSYAAFVPAFVLTEIIKMRNRSPNSRFLNEGMPNRTVYGRAMRSETTAEAAVLFADISGFTKLTEKLNRRLNGAELLCAELDVVYGALCEEADVLGGDAVKFSGDAVCFVWVVESAERGGADLAQATRRAALCAHRAHARIKRHPAVEGVKLTLHAGLSAGRLTLLSITRARPAGQRQRSEFLVAGVPLEQIGIAECVLPTSCSFVHCPSSVQASRWARRNCMLARGVGECSFTLLIRHRQASRHPQEHIEDYFDGKEPLTKVNPLPEEANGYVMLNDLIVEEEFVVDEPEMPLMATTVQNLVPADVELIAPFVPRAFERVLRSRHATATFVEHAKHSKAEIRELTVAFCCFHGVIVADQTHLAQEMVSCVDWAVRVRRLL